jgi:hypothetical protein
MNEAAVLNVVDKIAEKLAVPATEILNAYAASAIRLTPGVIVFGMLFIVSVIMSWKFAHSSIKSLGGDEMRSYVHGLLSALFMIVGTMTITALVSNLSSLMFWFSNPKAYAIVTLMDKLAQ